MFSFYRIIDRLVQLDEDAAWRRNLKGMEPKMVADYWKYNVKKAAEARKNARKGIPQERNYWDSVMRKHLDQGKEAKYTAIRQSNLKEIHFGFISPNVEVGGSEAPVAPNLRKSTVQKEIPTGPTFTKVPGPKLRKL